jgi:hypothetical protein
MRRNNFGMICAGLLAAVLACGQGGQGSSGGNGPSGSPSNGNGGTAGGGAGPLTLTLKVPNEVAPPGGVAQMKFLVTEPTPISSGRPHGFIDSSMFDAVWGIQVFNANGDANGVAIVKIPDVWVSFESTGSVQGTDYPVMTFALHVKDGAAVGNQSLFTVDPFSLWTIGAFPAIVKPIPPATVTVGGTISVTNVVPGGGLLPAGSIVKIEGIGFQPRTQVQITGIQPGPISVVSANEIDVTLAQPTDMTGKMIHVVNPDGSQDSYFSYLRGIDLGSSNRSILSSAIPIFSQVKHSQATFSPIAAPIASQFTGLAMQNPNLTDAQVTVTYQLGGRSVVSEIAIPSGYRFMREIQDLMGVPAAPGSSIAVTSDQPIQIFGFLVDPVLQTVTPFPATTAQP